MIGCDGADPHNSLTLCILCIIRVFPHKTEQVFHFSDKKAAYYPQIDYDFFLKQ